jgi:hypothetical protein
MSEFLSDLEGTTYLLPAGLTGWAGRRHFPSGRSQLVTAHQAGEPSIFRCPEEQVWQR